jgi:hypothetical protein
VHRGLLVATETLRQRNVNSRVLLSYANGRTHSSIAACRGATRAVGIDRAAHAINVDEASVAFENLTTSQSFTASIPKIWDVQRRRLQISAFA